METIKQQPFGFTVSPADPCMLFKENNLGICIIIMYVTVSPADPCMLFKENNLGICIIIMYVDDMLIIGKRAQIQEYARMIQKEFSV